MVYLQVFSTGLKDFFTIREIMIGCRNIVLQMIIVTFQQMWKLLRFQEYTVVCFSKTLTLCFTLQICENRCQQLPSSPCLLIISLTISFQPVRGVHMPFSLTISISTTDA